MPVNPVLADAGPDSPAIDIVLRDFDGTAHDARGIVHFAATSAGETGAAWADAGALAWAAYDGDVGQLEFIEYADTFTGNRVRRRIIFRERVTGSASWNTVRIVLADENAVLMDAEADFSADFATA